jgi:hypothetical protein
MDFAARGVGKEAMVAGMRRTVRTTGVGHQSAESVTLLACPLCHHPAVRVLSVAEGLQTIIVQCTGCLQESTLQCLPPDSGDDAEDE